MPNEKPSPVIFQILPKLESGGVERGVIDISKAAKEAGFTPIVISAGGVMSRQLKEFKIEHITLPVNSKNPFVIYKNIQKIADLIKERHAKLVHVRSRAPAWSAYFACRKAKCKLISTFHGTYSLNFLGKKKSFLKMKYNEIMLKADVVIAVSNFIKNHIKENYPFAAKIADENLPVIHRGVDLVKFSAANVSKPRVAQIATNWNLPDDKVIIMLPARITAWKGHEFLIDSLAKVKNENFFCIMVGSDKNHESYRKKLEKRIVKKNLGGKVQFVGTTKDMSAAYLVSDLVISASVKPEAFGRIAIEAGAMGRVIIATNIGGSLETIIPGKTGFLVEVNNSDDLAKKIDQVLSMDKTEKEQICENAKNHITKNFSNEKMYKKTIDLYTKTTRNL